MSGRVTAPTTSSATRTATSPRVRFTGSPATHRRPGAGEPGRPDGTASFVVGPFVVGPFVVGPFVVGPFVVGPFVVGSFVVGPVPAVKPGPPRVVTPP
ncbi:hypothetical protein Pme01_27350 [Planosporangium mesophilum]|uniref:Uncharacterized protein n=1 Tax=Planosporangium mesophilum TaxID=689768 RepID=A0A8J3TAS0_9ACTN|nr:hypothetical protein Pme01_27350 [Planosporangium mesophilum]